MSVSLVKVLCEGGCYWKNLPNSPGHSIAIPNGTRFKIAVDGPQSHRLLSGTCVDGYFAMEEGAHAGAKFLSANEAVNTVRAPQSNAFLYIQFLVEGKWIGADELRRIDTLSCDDVEEDALDTVVDLVRKKYKKDGTTKDDAQVLSVAANVVDTKPAFIENARKQKEIMASLMIDIGPLLEI